MARWWEEKRERADWKVESCEESVEACCAAKEVPSVV